MKSTAIIISIVFVILHVSSVDCFKSKFNRKKLIHGSTLSPGSCPDGSIPVGGVCNSIEPSDSASFDDHVVFKRHCQRSDPEGIGACDDHNERIGTHRNKLLEVNTPCPSGQTRVGNLCHNIVHLEASCPEGYRLIHGVCYTKLTRRRNCPESYEFIDGACREKEQ